MSWIRVPNELRTVCLETGNVIEVVLVSATYQVRLKSMLGVTVLYDGTEADAKTHWSAVTVMLVGTGGDKYRKKAPGWFPWYKELEAEI